MAHSATGKLVAMPFSELKVSLLHNFLFFENCNFSVTTKNSVFLNQNKFY